MRVAARYCILSCLILLSVSAVGEPRGLWLLPRKDAQNTARADLPAAMAAAPHEVWRFGGNPNNFAALHPTTVNGRPAYLALAHDALRLLQPDGGVIWTQPKLGVTEIVAVDDFDGDGSPEALAVLGSADVALVDLRDGLVRWTWTAPTGSNVSSSASWKVWRHGREARFIVFPQNALRGIGLDLARHSNHPTVVWDRAYANAFWQGFGPHIVLADMDKDGVPDVVLAGKPGYAAVIDAGTGATKFDVHYEVTGGPGEIGRPYGLLTATDLDGDGFPDIVMVSCQVEEYLSVIHNEGGKSLRPVWSRFLEKDLPEDKLELRPNVTSVADLRGDGHKELVVGLFNVTGDGRWHTVVIDPMKGFNSRLADWPDQYFWGCYDLDGDGLPAVITSTEHARKPAAASTLHAWDGRLLTEVATVPDAAFATTGGDPLGPDVGFMAIRNTPRFFQGPTGELGLLLTRRDGKPTSSLWSMASGASRFADLPISPLASVVALSTGTRPAQLDLGMPKLAAPSVSVTGPLIAQLNGRPQLAVALSDGTTMIGEPDLTHSGAFRSSHKIPGSMSACWLSPRGELTVATVTDDSTVLLSHPGQADDQPTSIHLPHPMYRNSATRSGPTLLPFGDGDEMKLFVGLQTGVHTMASALYDAAGRPLWTDEMEGPYPRLAAAAKLGKPDGPYSLVVDNHGKHLIYDMAGKSTLIAHGWNNTIPGRGDGAKYVVPMVGPFAADGATRILMTSGLQAIETLDAAGKRLAKWDTASTYEFEWNGAAVARLRGPAGGWDLAMVTRDGLLYCVDVTTCKPRWTYDLHGKATVPINIVSGDLDGDGKDELLVGLPNGSLVAIADREGKPAELWHVELDAGIREAILGDLDGDGRSEIVVETEEGSVRVFK